MSSTYYTIDPHRTVISLKGQDSQKLLQGLVTQDIRQLQNYSMVYTWLLNGQSRFLHDFHVILDTDETIYLTPEQSGASDLKSLLNLYKLKADVTIDVQDQTYHLVRIWGDDKCPTIAIPFYPDLRHPQLGFLGLCPLKSWDDIKNSLNNQGYQEKSFDVFDCHRLSLSVPDGGRDLIKGRTFPLEISHDAFGAVSLSKGCYLGQELVARTKHQGLIQKVISNYKGSGPTPPAIGSEIVDHVGKKQGTILSVYHTSPTTWCGFARINRSCMPNWDREIKLKFFEEGASTPSFSLATIYENDT